MNIFKTVKAEDYKSTNTPQIFNFWRETTSKCLKKLNRVPLSHNIKMLYDFNANNACGLERI